MLVSGGGAASICAPHSPWARSRHLHSASFSRRAAGAATSTTSISTSQFVNQFDAEPYVGNGYFSQRIPAAGMGLLTGLGTIGWPLGTPRYTEALAAGVYAKTNASVGFYPDETKQVIAPIPTWSTLTFATPSGETYSPATVTASQISDYSQTEDLQTGTVTTSGVWTSPHGRKASFQYSVFTDLARKHVAVVSLSLTPQWNGNTTVTGLLDGQGATADEPSGTPPRMQPAATDPAGVDLSSNTSHVTAQAVGTGFIVAESSTLQSSVSGAKDAAVGLNQPMTAGEAVSFPARAGQTYVFTKYVGVVTEPRLLEPRGGRADRFATGRRDGRVDARLRERLGVGGRVSATASSVSGDPALQTAINANTHDLYASIRSDSPDAIGPSGLSSDGYAGMVFWDSDIWMFPAILATHPDIARAAVDYRFNTLAAAEHDASANGYQGAFYPWTAGDDGYTGSDCYGTTTDSNDKIISDPNFSCSQELHLQADIAISQWEYYEATGDKSVAQRARLARPAGARPVLGEQGDARSERRLRHQHRAAARRVSHRRQQLRLHQRGRRHRAAGCGQGGAGGRPAGRRELDDGGQRAHADDALRLEPQHLRRVRRLQRRAGQAGRRGHAHLSASTSRWPAASV